MNSNERILLYELNSPLVTNKFKFIPVEIVNTILQYFFNSLKDMKKESYYSVILVSKLFYRFSFFTFDYNPYIKKIIKKCSIGYIKLLLEKTNLNPEIKDNDVISLFLDQYVEKIKLLLKDKRVDLSVRNNKAIKKAVQNNQIKIVKLLLENKRVDPCFYKNNLTKWAIKNKHFDVIKFLLNDSRINFSLEQNILIRLASRCGCFEAVELLLKNKKVNPSDNNNESIISASEKGHTEIVELLLKDDRVNPSARDNEAIQLASMNGHVETVKILLYDGRVDPSANDNRAIERATRNGHDKIVKLLLNDDKVKRYAAIYFLSEWLEKNEEFRKIAIELQKELNC